MKIHFVASNDQFIKLIISELAQRGHDCTVARSFNPDDVAQADVIWCEWADDNAIAVTEYVTPAKKILRVHDYEIHTDIWGRVSTNAFNAIVMVAEHKKLELETVLGRTLDNAIVIPNYIPVDAFNFLKGKEKNKNIAMLGFVCRRKGIGELLLIAESLPEYTFHVAGYLQEPDYIYMLSEGSPRNLIYHGYIDNVNQFYADKAYVINTSLREAFAVATVEGMLCGCKPIVRHWRGAEDIYPEECLFNSVADIKCILNSEWNAEENRADAIDTGCGNTINQIEELIAYIHRDKEEAIPSLTVGIVQTRVKYLPQLLHSLRLQNYPITVDIIQNFDRDKSIGQCFNELADRCNSEWILFVGDDDWLAENYIRTVMESYLLRKDIYPTTQAILTSTVAFDDQGRYSIIPHYSTGFWRAECVREHRFDETLVRQVDTEFHTRIQSLKTGNAVIINMPWIAGYFYRQHEKNVSGNKFNGGANTSQEPVKDGNNVK